MKSEKRYSTEGTPLDFAGASGGNRMKLILLPDDIKMAYADQALAVNEAMDVLLDCGGRLVQINYEAVEETIEELFGGDTDSTWVAHEIIDAALVVPLEETI